MYFAKITPCVLLISKTFRRLIREPNSQQHQTMKCELIPFEPEEESTQLQFEESTGEESQRMIMKVS